MGISDYFDCYCCHRNIKTTKYSFKIENYADIKVCKSCNNSLRTKLNLEKYPDFYYCIENTETKNTYVATCISEANDYISTLPPSVRESENEKYKCGILSPYADSRIIDSLSGAGHTQKEIEDELKKTGQGLYIVYKNSSKYWYISSSKVYDNFTGINEMIKFEKKNDLVGTPRRFTYSSLEDEEWSFPDKFVTWLGSSFDFDPRLYVEPKYCVWSCTLQFLEEELNNIDEKICRLEEKRKSVTLLKRKLLSKQKEMLM